MRRVRTGDCYVARCNWCLCRSSDRRKIILSNLPISRRPTRAQIATNAVCHTFQSMRQYSTNFGYYFMELITFLVVFGYKSIIFKMIHNLPTKKYF